MTIRSRVKAGIRFLDRVYGRRKWMKKVNVDDLDMNYPNRCILGQTDSDYYQHKDKLKLSNKRAYNLGFHTDPEGGDEYQGVSMSGLTAEWTKQLERMAEEDVR